MAIGCCARRWPRSLLQATSLLLWTRSLGAELHPGHQAVHQTALWRQPRRKRQGVERGEMVQIAEDGGQVVLHGVANATTATKLKDMTSEYIGVIGVGTDKDGGPQFQARVVFDTGSTNLWVASVLCKTYPCTHMSSSRFYDPEKSLTQEAFVAENEKAVGGDIDIMFGTGELRGPLHIDTYRVGPLKVQKQPFAMIREMNGEVFSSFPFEGILGLAFKSLSFGGIEPFFERVIQQKLLEHNEFAFYLNVDSDKPSSLLWGGIDQSLFEGPLHMFPVVQAHYWALELVDLRFGERSLLQGTSPRVNKVIVDSGTTYFTAPSSLHERILEHMPRASCSAVDSYAPLTYVLRGSDNQTFDLKVTQETYMVGTDGGEDCRPSFMKLDINNKYGPALILGEVFMRHFFTVFSRGDGSDDQAKVGFARAKMGAVPQVALDNKHTPSFLQEVAVSSDGQVSASSDGHTPAFFDGHVSVSSDGRTSHARTGRLVRRERP